MWKVSLLSVPGLPRSYWQLMQKCFSLSALFKVFWHKMSIILSTAWNHGFIGKSFDKTFLSTNTYELVTAVSKLTARKKTHPYPQEKEKEKKKVKKRKE